MGSIMMINLLSLAAGKTREEAPLQLARVVIKMRIDARDIMDQVKFGGLLHVRKP